MLYTCTHSREMELSAISPAGPRPGPGARTCENFCITGSTCSTTCSRGSTRASGLHASTAISRTESWSARGGAAQGGGWRTAQGGGWRTAQGVAAYGTPSPRQALSLCGLLLAATIYGSAQPCAGVWRGEGSSRGLGLACAPAMPSARSPSCVKSVNSGSSCALTCSGSVTSASLPRFCSPAQASRSVSVPWPAARARPPQLSLLSNGNRHGCHVGAMQPRTSVAHGRNDTQAALPVHP